MSIVMKKSESKMDDQLKRYQIESMSFEESEFFQYISKIEVLNNKKGVSDYETLYKELWDATKTSILKEKDLTKTSRSFKQKILGERISVEKSKLDHEESLELISNLEKESMESQIEADKAERSEMIVHYELQRLDEEGRDITSKIEEIQKANLQIVGPELDRLQGALYSIKDEQDLTSAAIKKEEKYLEEVDLQLEEIKKCRMNSLFDIENNKKTYEKLCNEIKGKVMSILPLESTLDKLKLEAAILTDQISSYSIDISTRKEKKKELQLATSDSKKKYIRQQEALDLKQKDFETILKTLDLEKSKNHTLATERLEIELALRKQNDNIKHNNSAIALETKQLNILKRAYLKKIQVNKISQDLISQLELKLGEGCNLLSSLKEENDIQEKTISEKKEEVDNEMIFFLSQDSLEKNRQDNLNYIIDEIQKKEGEIQEWLTEEKKLSKIIYIKIAQRDLKEREAMRCFQNEKDLKQKNVLKEFITADLKKKICDTRIQLRDYRTLFEMIQKSRVEHYGMIESSKKILIELKEKSTEKQAELNSLEKEIVAKENILLKETESHEGSMLQRATLRAEYYKVQSDCAAHQNKIISQKSEVLKLQNMIRSLQRDAKRQHRQNERVNAFKTFTEKHLVERTKEIHDLKQKVYLYTETLRLGEKAVKRADDDYDTLKLHHEEVARYLNIAKNKLPQILMLNVKLSKVEEEIEKERADTKHLCLDLEDPDNHDRWREVGEMIPDQELLNAKIAVLEQRLSNNKENLLEKELVIDDIVSLTERLKLRQNSAKSKMQPIIQKLNTLKVKVKDINRRIKAVVSELSMYQATAIRLEQEKAGKEKLLKTSKDLFEKGEPPNDDALISFERLQREYYAVLSAKSPNSSSMERNCYHVPNAIKRTVKSRPSAYIPDNDPIGLPKPYGAMAPFKPAQNGSTMRHIRPPESKDIEI